MPLPESSELFLKYDYAETKEMCKHFLTLVTAVLAFSLTFADKLLGISKSVPFTKYGIFTAWVLFLSSIIFCGLGLVFNSLAGGAAVYGAGNSHAFEARRAYKWVLAAGTCFVIGLLVLIVTGIGTMLSA